VRDLLLWLRRYLQGLCRFLWAIVRHGWGLVGVLGVVAGLSLLNFLDLHWTLSKVLLLLVIVLLLALHAGARLEVKLQGDLPITISVQQGGVDAVFLEIENELGVPVQFSARVWSDPQPPGVQRDWSGLWQEEESKSSIDVPARGKGVLWLVAGEMAVVDAATDEHPRLMHGAISFMRSGPGQHSINYPPETRPTFETAVTDADVAAVSVKAYVKINRAKPVHSTTFAFRVAFVERKPTTQNPMLAYAVDVTRVDDDGRTVGP
jgi:hypothetical protein